MHFIEPRRPPHYNYYRDLDPSLGRYVESDPMGMRAGANTYIYVFASPLGRSDRRGLFAEPGADQDPDYKWQPQPGDRNPGNGSVTCLLSCLAIKTALGAAGADFWGGVSTQMRDRSLGFGSRATRLMIGKGGAAIAFGKAAMGETPAGIILGLGAAMDFCDDFCRESLTCKPIWNSPDNPDYPRLPPLPVTRR